METDTKVVLQSAFKKYLHFADEKQLGHREIKKISQMYTTSTGHSQWANPFCETHLYIRFSLNSQQCLWETKDPDSSQVEWDQSS